MVVQTAVVNFVEWLQDPEGNLKFTVQAFQAVPQDLARRITLLQSVEMVRVAMEFFEKWLPLLARNDAQLRALTEAVLRYGREIGFAAAAIYASAAESRGAWDSRLEALVVDAVVRGDTGPTLCPAPPRSTGTPTRPPPSSSVTRRRSRTCRYRWRSTRPPASTTAPRSRWSRGRSSSRS